MEKFGRNYRLDIDVNTVETTSSKTEVVTKKRKVTRLSITDLQITGRVTSSKEGRSEDLATSKINIYNLSDSTIAQIKKGSGVLLYTWYDNESPSLLYSGEVVFLSTTWSGSNKITTLVCSGDYVVRTSVRASKTWQAGVTYREVIEDLVGLLRKSDTIVKHVITEPEYTKNKPNGFSDKTKQTFATGYSFSGYVFKELVRLCSEVDLVAYYVNNALVVEPKEYTKDLEVVVLKKGTFKAPKTPLVTKEGDNGWNIQVPLDGSIQLSNLADIETDDGFVLCNIVEVSHSFDFYNDQWTTTLKTVVR